jgi:cellobiose-specific phosphotransferase system component IIC
MIDPTYEKRVRRAIAWAFVLCLCAAIPPLLSLVGSFRPQAEPPGQWFERSGAVMTAFAVFAQFRASGIATLIAGGTFGESWEAYYKYKRHQAVAAALSLVLVVLGTVVWGYGDLLFPRPRTE